MRTKPVAPGTLHVWAIYLQASEEARSQGDRRTGTDHILLALLEDPSIEFLLGVDLERARQVLASLDRDALVAVGLVAGDDAPLLTRRAVPTRPKVGDVARRDRLRMTPAAKRVLVDASTSNRRKLYVTAPQVLAQILTLQPPDPAAVLLEALGVDAARVARHMGPILPLR